MEERIDFAYRHASTMPTPRRSILPQPRVSLLRAEQEMQADGIKPDQIAYGTVLSACATAGEWEKARSLLRDMRRAGLCPDVVAYRCEYSLVDNTQRAHNGVIFFFG